MLIDADLASNNGGWQWSAGTGTDPQPYFRIFNPYNQSEKVRSSCRTHRTCFDDLPRPIQLETISGSSFLSLVVCVVQVGGAQRISMSVLTLF